MEYISIQGRVQILNTTDRSVSAEKVVRRIRAIESVWGYVSANMIQINAHWLAVDVSMEAAVSDSRETMLILNSLSEIMGEDSSITIHQDVDDPWSKYVSLNS